MADEITTAEVLAALPAPRTDLCTVCNKYPSHVEHRHPAQPAPEADEWEPMLVSAMRRRPVGEVIYQPANGPKMGTTARTFLAEYDRVRRSHPAPRTVTAEEVERAVLAATANTRAYGLGASTVVPDERGVILTALAALGITVEVTP